MVQDYSLKFRRKWHVTALDLKVRTSLKLKLLLLFIKEFVFGSWIGFIWLITISIVMLLYSKAERVKKLWSFWTTIPQSCCGISDFQCYVVKDYWFLRIDIRGSALGYPEDGGSKLLKTSMLYYKPPRRKIPEDCNLQRLSFSEKGFWWKRFCTWHLRVIPADCLRLRCTSFGAMYYSYIVHCN
jgi:hypothetical protein